MNMLLGDNTIVAEPAVFVFDDLFRSVVASGEELAGTQEVELVICRISCVFNIDPLSDDVSHEDEFCFSFRV